MRDAETLRRPYCHVCSHLAGGRQQGEGKEVGGDRHHDSSILQLGDQRPVVSDLTTGPRVLEQHGVGVGAEEVGRRVADEDLDPERLGASLDHVDRLRMAVGIHEEHV